jgi:hypothetical protein
MQRQVLVIGLLLVLAPMVRADDDVNRSLGVLPVDSHAFGASYAEWSVRNTQWFFSLPVDHHPLFDTADCSAGQSGHVWFLGGTFTTTNVGPNEVIGRVTRNCTIPAGKALFFPIVDGECSAIEGNGTTEAALRLCAQQQADVIDPASLRCEIDGQSVQNLAQFRVQSPLFTFGPLPENNLLESFGINAPAGATSPSVSDGYFLLLTPRSVGRHTIHFYGEADFRSMGGPLFIEDITYNLTVTP